MSEVKLVTSNSDRVKGLKTLNKVPESLKGIDFKNERVRIIDAGNLWSFKKFMTSNTDQKRDDDSDSSRSEGMWSGTKTWATYLDLLNDGDKELIASIKTNTKKAVADLSKRYKDVINNYKFDVTGQFFDVGLVLSGVPESWLEPEIDEEEITKIDLVLDGAFHASFDKDTLSRNISRILAMVKILEDNGVEVGIKLISGNQSWDGAHREDLVVLTHIKNYDEPINFKKITSLLTPAYHRRGIFKIIEMQADRVGNGYGRPRHYEGAIALLKTYEIDALEDRLFKGEK